MEIKHLIFLIHPGCYEVLPPDSPLHQSNIGLFIEREQEVKLRWLAALDEYGKESKQSTLFLQLYGPEYLLKAAQEQLGEANACYVQADFSTIPAGLHQLREYYHRLTQCIQEHMIRFDLSFDPAEVTSEIWGESFEGCASCYSSAFAESLGLKRAPRMRFEMTVYDSRFLYGAKAPETIQLAGTDIEAWLFELYDRTSAVLFQARLHAQYYDQRPIQLLLDPARVQVCTTSGFTVWPEEGPTRVLAQPPVPFVLTTSNTYWLRGTGMNVSSLREVVASAVVDVD